MRTLRAATAALFALAVNVPSTLLAQDPDPRIAAIDQVLGGVSGTS